jgi:uncharacterized protein YkwD
MLARKMCRRLLWVCVWSGIGCQDASDDSGQQGEIGEPASLSWSEPEEDESDVGSLSEALVAQRLCRACTTSADCGGLPNRCLRRADGVKFCGGDCRSAACPTGYACTRLGFGVYQCVPPQADCSRVPAADAGPSADAGTSADAGASADAGTSADAGASTDASAADAAASADASVADAGARADAGPDAAGSVPPGAYCAPVASWDPSWSAFEDEVLRLSNQARQAGAVCGAVSYAPAPPLATSPALRCAARLHSKDMQDRDYFSHTTPDGVTFDQRITAAGYRWRTIGENIAAGYRTPQAVVQGWMQSPGHCQNIMNATFTQLGVGFYGDYSWTQDFGKPF